MSRVFDNKDKRFVIKGILKRLRSGDDRMVGIVQRSSIMKEIMIALAQEGVIRINWSSTERFDSHTAIRYAIVREDDLEERLETYLEYMEL